MAKSYVTSAFLQIHNSEVYVVFGWSQRKKQIVSSKAWLLIMEIFVHSHSLESAYLIYQKCKDLPIDEKVVLELEKYQDLLNSHNELVVSLLNNQVNVYAQGFKGITDQHEVIELSKISQTTYQVLPCLFSHHKISDDLDSIDNFDKFTQLVKLLDSNGILAPAVGEVDWGDFNRTAPICHACGFTRGTPIDRYYLKKFVEEVNDQIVGHVLEIGAVPKDKESYDFSNRPSYRVLNLEAGPGVDIVGDVHDLSLIEAESVDSIVMFNVLEHCYAPWEAVENMRRWLKPGGKCFCLVPSTQRLHERPADYWRLLPDGMTLLFKNFTRQKLYVYGNPMSVVATFHGIAVEEMTTEDLDTFHPDYPVVTCVVAEK